MDFAIPSEISADCDRFKAFIKAHVLKDLFNWNTRREIPKPFFQNMGAGGWYSLETNNGRLSRGSALRKAIIAEELAKVSPGVAVAALAHVDLGLMGLLLFGSERLHKAYGRSAAQGKTVMCLGNTENLAGSDVAGISMTAGS